MTAEGAGLFHRPVMVAEVTAQLKARPGRTIVDATLGGGGHAAAILEALAPGGELIGIDRDREAIAWAERSLKRPGVSVRLLHGRMGEIEQLLDACGVREVDGVLADLGVSSHQLDARQRGFSFQGDAPLDMRMDPTAGESAAELVHRLPEAALADLLWELGEERHARRIARAIKARGAMRTTGELAAAVIAAMPPGGRRGRIHPATRTFQALRIAVNDEMGELERLLAAAPRRLRAGGRMVVISYHSLEDRRVKRAFRALAAGGGYRLPSRRALRPTEGEISENPRARSARLRVLEKQG